MTTPEILNRALILSAVFFGFAVTALAALGESEGQCDDRYGEKLGRNSRDFYSGNVACAYRVKDREKGGAVVNITFSRKDVAIEIKVFGTFTDAQVEKWLSENGNGWTLEKPKLGSAMDARKVRRWLEPSGKVAELEPGNTAFYLRIFSPERLNQFKERGMKEPPKP